jgi:hypothetical protein
MKYVDCNHFMTECSEHCSECPTDSDRYVLFIRIHTLYLRIT